MTVAKLNQSITIVPFLPQNQDVALPVPAKDLVVMGHSVVDTNTRATTDTLQKGDGRLRTQQRLYRSQLLQWRRGWQHHGVWY